MTMGEKMQKLRKQKNWSQETLAEKLGVSRQAVSLWERGESMPEIDKLIPLARLFGVTADYLLDDTQEAPSEKPQPSVPHQRPENPHFVQAFPFATLLDCAGLLCSALLWRQFQTPLSLLPGLLLQLLALTIALACAALPVYRTARSTGGAGCGTTSGCCCPSPSCGAAACSSRYCRFPTGGRRRSSPPSSVTWLSSRSVSDSSTKTKKRGKLPLFFVYLFFSPFSRTSIRIGVPSKPKFSRIWFSRYR